ncbi:MAG: hypothetical protein Sapg2KO_06300 [Saprospiraceae bacterium]
MYQKTTIYLALTILLLSSSSLVRAQTDTSLDERKLLAALTEYNVNKSSTLADSRLLYGKTTVQHDEIGGTNRIRFFIQDRFNLRNFNFQYEKSKDQIQFPAIIKNSRITYLGHQLIIEDLDQKKVYSFLIEGYPALFSGVSSELGVGLGSGSRRL